MWLPKMRKLVPETPPHPLPLKAPPSGSGRPKQKWPKYITLSQIMIVNAKKSQLEGGQNNSERLVDALAEKHQLLTD